MDTGLQRRPTTSSRPALNGYQESWCRYRRGRIHIHSGDGLPDDDRFFPHVLKAYGFGRAIDGVWNLVLACRA